jgi:hypothetical protein
VWSASQYRRSSNGWLWPRNFSKFARMHGECNMDIYDSQCRSVPMTSKRADRRRCRNVSKSAGDSRRQDRPTSRDVRGRPTMVEFHPAPSSARVRWPAPLAALTVAADCFWTGHRGARQHPRRLRAEHGATSHRDQQPALNDTTTPRSPAASSTWRRRRTR